jgi:beta-glucanase (GH16 family)
MIRSGVIWAASPISIGQVVYMLTVTPTRRKSRWEGEAGVISKWKCRRRAAQAFFAGALSIQAVAVLSPGILNAEPPTGNTNCTATAASSQGWGVPNAADDFNDSSLANWYVYDSPGHAGNGRRTPNAVAVADGLLTITGDAAGNSGGMAFKPNQKYGRWEVCTRSSVAAPGYQSLALLWPGSDNWPADGEIDFMEIKDPQRQAVEVNLHWGPVDRWQTGTVLKNATQWHSWAVEWTPDRITTYVDGEQWWQTTDTVHFPRGPMHLCLQLDNVGGDISTGGQQVTDWVRQYSI